ACAVRAHRVRGPGRLPAGGGGEGEKVISRLTAALQSGENAPASPLRAPPMFVRVICPVCRLNRRVDDRQLPLRVACPQCPDSSMDLDPKSLPPIEVTPSVLTRRGRGFAIHPSIRVASLWDRFLGAVIDAGLGIAVALPGAVIVLAGGSEA